MSRGDRFVTVSIFSGIGGLDLGLERAGFLVRTQAENNKWAKLTLNANRHAFRSRRLTLLDNVRDITAEQIIEAARPSKKWGIALLAGGPPCQSFSSAGTRRGWKDERGGLVADYMRLLEGLQPRGFLFENVIGFADAVRTTDGVPEPLLDWFLRKAVKAGYAVSWGVIDAADYGAPQHRERFIIMGSKLEFPPAFPNPTHGPYGVERHRTLRNAFAGLDEDALHDLGCMGFSVSKREILSQVPEGGNWRDLPDDVMMMVMGTLALEWGGKTGYWRRLAWDKPSPTVMSRPDHRATCFCHPEELRPLSVREFARLQCLPDKWNIQGPLWPRYRQVGDAVPVNLGLALGRAMKAHLEGSKLARLDGVPLNSMLRPGRNNRKIGLWGWSAGKRLRVVYEPPRTALRREIALLKEPKLLAVG